MICIVLWLGVHAQGPRSTIAALFHLCVVLARLESSTATLAARVPAQAPVQAQGLAPVRAQESALEQAQESVPVQAPYSARAQEQAPELE